ncbi:hypothetical protein BB558_004470 [Smittium angustum]|uniref:Prolyl 4-hydroxylase alpha subunit domain-containing protein n=1 Tax=Smittium angustum TaxID=133377 RepID=A0A2U1J363_SMIAN|nr:hypothetical protein BB558_004470 [Smittium angustum]
MLHKNEVNLSTADLDQSNGGITKKLKMYSKDKKTNEDKLELSDDFVNNEFRDTFRKIFCNESVEGTEEIYVYHDDKKRKYTVRNNEDNKSIENENQLKLGSVVGSPFKVGVLHDVFDKSFLCELKEELGNLEWRHRSNDLYDFYQTDDLTVTCGEHVKNVQKLYGYLSSDDFISFMETISNTKLVRNRLDLAAQQYKHGGDENNQPISVVKKLVPNFNTLAFFVTGKSSYHEVQEVLRKDGINRWSVTGWFYENVENTEELLKNEFPSEFTSIYDIIPKSHPLQSISLGFDTLPDEIKDGSDLLGYFINKDYLDGTSQQRILDNFLENSSIELKKFLKDNIYKELVKQLCSSENFESVWKKYPVLPPIVRKYYLIDENKYPTRDSKKGTDVADAVLKFFKSTEFSNYLTSITNLDFVKSSQEVRMFNKGCYTLIHDKVIEPEGLDVVFSFMGLKDSTDGSESKGETQWNSEKWDGGTHYICEEDELLTIEPDHNTLSLVFRTEETKRFVKMVKSDSQFPRCEINMVFIEQ